MRTRLIVPVALVLLLAGIIAAGALTADDGGVRVQAGGPSLLTTTTQTPVTPSSEAASTVPIVAPIPVVTTVPMTVPVTEPLTDPLTTVPSAPEPAPEMVSETAPAAIPDVVKSDATQPAMRVEKGCSDDPACTAPPEPKYRQPPDGAACPQWWETAQAAGWPASAMDKLDFVMKRESGCNPHAHNASGASGLVQLMPMHWRGKFDPYDPFMNLHKGYELWTTSGWAPWEVCGFRQGC